MAIQEVLVSKIFNYTSEPTKKVEGQFWFNPSTNVLSRYDGTIWKPITVSSDDVAVLTDGNKVSLTNYLNTSIAALAEGIDTKQDISNLITTINNTSDDTHYPSAKAVYTYAHASITSTTEITITPSSAQTATPITNALAKKARVVVTPSLSNNGAIYIKESTTYSSLNPIYPDPTNNVYEFSNMQNVNIFADFAGDSVDLTIEYRG